MYDGRRAFRRERAFMVVSGTDCAHAQVIVWQEVRCMNQMCNYLSA